MTRFAESDGRDAKLAALKQLISAGNYDTIEKLEDAVDELLWSEHDRLQQMQGETARDMARSHPK
jgi:hypothetical protein